MLFGFNADEVFRIAIEIEENGKEFYEKAERKIDNEEVKELFRELAREEFIHKKRFSELRAQLPELAKEGQVFDPDNEMGKYIKMMADMHVFRSGQDLSKRLETISSAKDALKMAIDFEKDSIVFFLLMQDNTDEKTGKKLVGQLLKEEQEHLRKLST